MRFGVVMYENHPGRLEQDGETDPVTSEVGRNLVQDLGQTSDVAVWGLVIITLKVKRSGEARKGRQGRKGRRDEDFFAHDDIKSAVCSVQGCIFRRPL